MDETYRLTYREHEAVYRRLEEEMLGSTTVSPSPRLLFLGGQPGSGRNTLAGFARKRVLTESDFAVINRDDYRKEHPWHRQILQANDRLFAGRTDPDVCEWTERLFASAVSNRRGIILKGTMCNRKKILETFGRLHEEDYRIDVFVMAVRAEDSRVGAAMRYEQQKAHEGYGCWVPLEEHEEAYKSILTVLQIVESESPIDSVRVWNRAGDLLYENIRRDGVLMKPPDTDDARAALFKERARLPGQEEQMNHFRQRQIVEGKMKARGAPLIEISETKMYMAGKINPR